MEQGAAPSCPDFLGNKRRGLRSGVAMNSTSPAGHVSTSRWQVSTTAGANGGDMHALPCQKARSASRLDEVGGVGEHRRIAAGVQEDDGLVPADTSGLDMIDQPGHRLRRI